MPEQIKLDENIFGYDELIKEGTNFIALRREGRPELRKGMWVVLLGDSQGYVPSSFKPDEEVTIIGFRESFKDGSSDHIIEVSNGKREGWVKPSNIQNKA
jgi:hypothetical protein